MDTENVSPLINSHVAQNLKNAVSQLKAEVDEAFSDIKGSRKISFDNSPAKTGSMTSAKASLPEQTLRLTEYLLNIKESQLKHVEHAKTITNKAAVGLAALFLDSLGGALSVQEVMDRLTDIFNSKALILWMQTGDSYEIRSSGISNNDAEEHFFSLLPVLAGKDEECFIFEYMKNFYFARTYTDSADNTVASVFIHKADKNFTKDDKEFGFVLSDILFKVVQK